MEEGCLFIFFFLNFLKLEYNNAKIALPSPKIHLDQYP